MRPILSVSDVVATKKHNFWLWHRLESRASSAFPADYPVRWSANVAF